MKSTWVTTALCGIGLAGCAQYATDDDLAGTQQDVADATADIDARLAALEATVSSQATEIVTLRADLAAAEADLAAAEADLAAVDQDLAAHDSELADHETRISDMESDVAALEVGTLADTLETLGAEVDALGITQGGLSTLIGDLVGDVEDLDDRTFAAEGNITGLQLANAAHETRLDDAEADLIDALADVADLETAVAARATTVALNATNTALTALTTRVTTAEGAIDAVELDVATRATASSVTTLTTRVTNAETDIDELLTDVADLQDWGSCDIDKILRPTGGQAIDSTLWAYWRMATTADASGHATRALTFTNVTETLGITADGDRGAYFDTSGDHAELAGIPFPQTAFTIEASIRTVSTANRFFFSYAVAGDDNEILWGLQGGRMEITVNGTALGFFGEDLDDGSWHHVALAWTGGGTVSVYADGALVGTATAPAGGLATNGTVVLGEDQDNVGGGFDSAQSWVGAIDEVLVYNRVVPAAEILDHYRTLTCGGR